MRLSNSLGIYLGSAGSFLPSQIPNLVMWLRSDLGVSPAGGPVATWADQSGNGNNATQPTGARQPTVVSSVLNGKPAIRFAINQTMIHPLTGGGTPRTFWAVASTSSTGYRVIICIAGNGGYLAARSTGSANWGMFATADVVSSYTLVSTPRCITARVTAANNMDLNTRGQTKETKTNGSGSIFGATSFIGSENSTGATSNLLGDVFELGIFNRVLTDAEVSALEAYAGERYGSV